MQEFVFVWEQPGSGFSVLQGCDDRMGVVDRIRIDIAGKKTAVNSSLDIELVHEMYAVDENVRS